MAKTKYIFICGGVMSGVGKGTATASIGKILQARGFEVTAMKIDPYINVDAGTMNPIEHGEVFVTEDGEECDQDIGNYERFLDKNIHEDNYMTTGKVYESVICKERNLEYNGRCVQVVLDIPNEVIRRIKKAGDKTKSDFVLIEIGGTVGEYENLLFLEAARILHLEKPRNVLFVLVSYLPVPRMLGEMKTKPTQHATRALYSAGIQPDIIIGRSAQPMDAKRKEKLSIFCNVQKEDIISAPDIESIYEVPINFEKDNLSSRILQKFDLKPKKKDLKNWKRLVNIVHSPEKKVKIGIAGKYFKSGVFTLLDSYISVIEAIKHASYYFKAEPDIVWINTEEYEKNPKNLKEIKNLDGIIVPGGFGSRGIEGKIKTIEYCRKKKIPFLGLCLGMQLAVVEFARNVCAMHDANSTEIKKTTKYPIIDIMEEQKINIKEKHYGGTMRLGAWDCKIKPKTKAHKAYKKTLISERHRHRFEVNNKFKKILEENGLVISGTNPQSGLIEIVEIPSHPFFVASQFHPEFTSRPLKPNPLFREFVKSSLKIKS